MKVGGQEQLLAATGLAIAETRSWTDWPRKKLQTGRQSETNHNASFCEYLWL